ncbi:MAG TPA: GNAT family N-acetyltransferase [Alphaproteobacteria bacterium]|nr:GNAT family N-acetyltransferase [Alphaproteobacteria bacterium]
MPDGREAATVRVAASISEIDAAAWDACAGGDNPFVSHAFLAACEDSRSAMAETGWLARHLALEDSAGALIGAVPLYAKSHSQGEYVFDHGWADAYNQAGGRYYPKLQGCVPFTPVPGPRILIRGGVGARADAEQTLAAAIVELARRHDLSSAHLTFVAEQQARRLAELGFLLRTGYQFHWHNRGYGSFEDFLGDMASRRRKNLRKERAQALSAGLKVRIATGRDIREADWDAFFDFYMETGSRKWGRPYLTRPFFSMLHAAMPEKIVLILAERAGTPVAGALNLRGRDALYGRYWGAAEEHPFLHFELCYYQAIEFAIAHGLARVEAGAQGEHKIQRGYLPQATYSAHYIRDSGFRDAVARFLAEESRSVAAEMAALSGLSPFKT